MTLDTLYLSLNGLAMLTSFFLIVTPHRVAAARVIAVGIAIFFAISYCVFLVMYTGTTPGGGFSSLPAVMKLFTNPGLVMMGWVHYLTFDLLVQLWERAEADRIGMSRWVLAPCMFMTLMLGPVGWLLFMVARAIRLRTINSSNTLVV